MRDGKRMGLAMFAILLFFAAAMPVFAYFTGYADTAGGGVVDVSCEPEIQEEVEPGEFLKHVSIKCGDTSGEMFVRVRAVAPRSATVSYGPADGWRCQDGWYYWDDVVGPGEATGILDVQAAPSNPDNLVGGADGNVPWDVHVVCEAVPAIYDDDGNPYPDWSLQYAPPAEAKGE